jgi:hypothetical protein
VCVSDDTTTDLIKNVTGGTVRLQFSFLSYCSVQVLHVLIKWSNLTALWSRIHIQTLAGKYNFYLVEYYQNISLHIKDLNYMY